MSHVKLVIGECARGTFVQRTSLLQMLLAVEWGSHTCEIISADEETAGYPEPRVIMPDGTVFFAPLSASCALLSVDDPASVLLDSACIVGGNAFNGNANFQVPKTLVGQIALFAAIHLSSQACSTELALFVDDFAKQPKVLKAIDQAGVVNVLAQKVRKGIEYKRDNQTKILPKEGERNILITSAIPYVNNVPHLGNIIGCILSADVFSRYCRLRGHNSVYICGTDEYGTATETKALEENMTCAEVCAKYYRIHAAIYDWFQIDCDIFGRTSTAAEQTKITHDIFNSLNSKGYFFEQSVEQTFCEKCTRFLADRYVEGVCPLCGFHDARGDQCDGCGKLINPVELVDPKCKLCKFKPVVKSSKHLFLDLSKLEEKCCQFVETSSAKGKWSSNSASIAKGWLNEGLKPRCMTRDLKWGTSVPVPGYEDKVFYVWFDAPIGYLSITATYTDEWEKWWKNPDQVQLYQFMGKDNVPFHTVMFPSTLLGTEQPFTLLHHINTTEYLNYESGKFSKSRGTGVFGNDARDSGIPAALWRYYLLSNRPEANDSCFTWDDFAAKINTELVANLGNFVNRTCKFLYAKLGGVLGETMLTENDRTFVQKVNEALNEYLDCMESVKLRAGLKVVLSISSLGNNYLQENRLDNNLLVNNPERCNTVISVAVNLCYLLSAIVSPYLPSVGKDICCILNAPVRQMPTSFSIDLLPGHTISRPFLLFHKIDDASINELRVKYAGKQQ